MAIFRRSETPSIPLIVSIAGARLGQRILVLPGRDRRILADLAARVGLTGRTLALTHAAAVGSVQQAAERAGTVADVLTLETPLPVADESFDLAVLDDRPGRQPPLDTVSLLPEILRSLRPGGRAIVLLPTGEGWVSRLVGGTASPPSAAESLLEALGHAGFRAARIVAVRDGVGYLEATRP